MSEKKAPSDSRDEAARIALNKWAAQWAEKMPFVAYAPFLTYSDASNRVFLDRNGKPIHRHPHNPDAEAIWDIGNRAFRLLNVRDRQDFLERYERFTAMVKEWRGLIESFVAEGKATDHYGNKLTLELLAIENREASEILSIAWEIIEQAESRGVVIRYELRAEHMAFACLHEIDNVLVGMDLDGRGAVSSAIQAANALADAQAYSNGSEAFRKARKQMAFDAAVARHRNDPKQAEKKFVFGCYTEWRANPTRYKSKAAFARDMLDKCQHLESQKKIEDWVRKWDNDAAGGTVPAE